MIKHIVMWKLKDELANKEEISLEIKKQIEELKSKIDGIIDIEIGINFESSEQAYDIVLYSKFNSKESLNFYQNHEEHIKVANFIKSVVKSRVVSDYEI